MVVNIKKKNKGFQAQTLQKSNICCTKPVVAPPAKNTSPDGSDAAAKYPRASPRPVG
jgi:hypothetical protein